MAAKVKPRDFDPAQLEICQMWDESREKGGQR